VEPGDGAPPPRRRVPKHVYPGLKTINMLNKVVLVLTYTERNATENSRSGGSLGQEFVVGIILLFFSVPIYSMKNSL